MLLRKARGAWKVIKQGAEGDLKRLREKGMGVENKRGWVLRN
jgi:hypothetical protein